MKNKKYNIKLLIAILLVFFFSGCHFNNKEIHEDAELLNTKDVPIINLKGEEIVFDSILLKPVDIEINGTNIITKNIFTDHIFHIYNVATNRKVGEKVTVGQGPDEMIFPLFSENNNEYISIFEHKKQTIFTYNASEFVNSEALRSIHEIELTKPVNTAFILNDRRIIGSTADDANSLFVLFKKDGTVEREFGKYPQSKLNLDDRLKIAAYGRSFAFNEESNKIMIFYFFTNLVDIYMILKEI